MKFCSCFMLFFFCLGPCEFPALTPPSFSAQHWTAEEWLLPAGRREVGEGGGRGRTVDRKPWPRDTYLHFGASLALSLLLFLLQLLVLLLNECDECVASPLQLLCMRRKPVLILVATHGTALDY